MPASPWIPFVLATLGFSAGNVVAKLLLNEGLAPLTVVPGRYLFAVPGLILGMGGARLLPGWSQLAWAQGAMLGVINMATPTLTMTVALQHLPASTMWMSQTLSATKSSLIGYLVPPLGALGGVLVLEEPVTSNLLISGALILTGVVLAERAERSRPDPITV